MGRLGPSRAVAIAVPDYSGTPDRPAQLPGRVGVNPKTQLQTRTPAHHGDDRSSNIPGRAWPTQAPGDAHRFVRTARTRPQATAASSVIARSLERMVVRPVFQLGNRNIHSSPERYPNRSPPLRSCEQRPTRVASRPLSPSAVTPGMRRVFVSKHCCHYPWRPLRRRFTRIGNSGNQARKGHVRNG
jgi:hypothetical protein